MFDLEERASYKHHRALNCPNISNLIQASIEFACTTEHKVVDSEQENAGNRLEGMQQSVGTLI